MSKCDCDKPTTKPRTLTQAVDALVHDNLIEETKQATIREVVKVTMKHISRSCEDMTNNHRHHNSRPFNTTKDSQRFAKALKDVLIKKLQQKL